MPARRQMTIMTDSTSNLGWQEAARLLKLMLLRSSADEFLEFRLIESGGRVSQHFVPVPHLQRSSYVPDLGDVNGVANVYHSAIPRTRRHGTAEACGLANTTWADFDEGFPDDLPVAPSLVVESSPGKSQAYWLLKTPCADLDRIEAVNRGIAALHGGDRKACDRARVLRLPGFRNLKYPNQPYAHLVGYRPDRQYSLDELETTFKAHMVGNTPQPLVRPLTGVGPSWLGLVYRRVVEHLSERGYLAHSSADGSVTALCPLHEDHRPSLSIHPVRGWKCFAGCGQGRLTTLAFKLNIDVRRWP